ncbi:MAG: methylated-DNA--[protein]-cysteine S-methyltransferase, partial [Tepidiformaceae bacterium]
GGGVCYAMFFHQTGAMALAGLAAAASRPGADPRASELAALLCGFADGAGPGLDNFPVDLPPCSDFHREVWLALREVPRGETRSYTWLARRVGRADAARAVGAAVGANPIPLWLPCHRIVGKGGHLHGFGGGLAMKQALLEAEGALPKRMVG